MCATAPGTINNLSVGDDAHIVPLYRTPCKTPCHCETSDRCHWLWQSVPSAPLPKGGWHGEAVTGGFLFTPQLL